MDIATIPNPKPARVCVTVSELGKGAKVSCQPISNRKNVESKLPGRD
jgi:hypothetical protein